MQYIKYSTLQFKHQYYCSIATLRTVSENSLLEKFKNLPEHRKKRIACDRHYWEKKLCLSFTMTHPKTGVSGFITF